MKLQKFYKFDFKKVLLIWPMALTSSWRRSWIIWIKFLSKRKSYRRNKKSGKKQGQLHPFKMMWTNYRDGSNGEHHFVICFSWSFEGLALLNEEKKKSVVAEIRSQQYLNCLKKNFFQIKLTLKTQSWNYSLLTYVLFGSF